MALSLFRSYVAAYQGLPPKVWLVSVVLLVNRSGTMVLPFWALYCTSRQSLTPSEAGDLLAVYGVGGILGSFSGGLLTSRLGAIPTALGSLVLTAVGFLILSASDTFVQMAGCMLGLSIVAEAVRPATVTATLEFCAPHQHARALALNRLAVNLGMSVGSVAGGFLATISFDWLFYVDAATSLAAALVMFLLFGWSSSRRLHTDHEPSSIPYRVPWKDRTFLLMLGLLLLQAIVFFQVLGTFGLYLRDHFGLDEAAIGALWSVNTLMIVACEMVLVRWVERFPPQRAVGWGSLLIGVGFGIVGLGQSKAVCLISVLIWTIGEMLAMPLGATYVSRRAVPRMRGVYMGCYTTTFSIAIVMAPLVGTRLYELEPGFLWAACTAVGLVTWIGFHLLPP
jgi:predicted MFS family arabinose efflux permease